MLEITYPLFLMDRDRLVFKINNEGELNYHLERIDVEDMEYVGWDSIGHPVELFIENSDIKARLTGHAAKTEELKEAMVRYGNMGKKPFAYSGNPNNYLELLTAAENHLESQGFWKKIKRWLSQGKQGRPN